LGIWGNGPLVLAKMVGLLRASKEKRPPRHKGVIESQPCAARGKKNAVKNAKKEGK